MRPSAASARTYFPAIRSALSSAKVLREQMAALLPAALGKQLHVADISPRSVTAGDEAYAVGGTVTLAGLRFAIAICAVRRGAFIARFNAIAVLHEAIPGLATTRLAHIAAARVDQALHG